MHDKTWIVFDSVSFQYEHIQVVENLSFCLKAGEVIVLFGPSGCGKTTILNLCVNLLQATKGTIIRNTKEIGYVFQEPRLLPWKTVVENVELVMDKKQRDRKDAVKALQQVGLSGQIIHQYPQVLSGGMKQRVSIARALVNEPQVILMDEPFSALDMKLKQDLQRDLIEIIQKRQVGILYVTHDATEAIRLADRIFILEEEKCRIRQELLLDTKHICRTQAFVDEKYDKIYQSFMGG